MKSRIPTGLIENALDYQAYSELSERLLAQGKTTGTDHSEYMLNYAKLNQQRIRRITMTTTINAELETAIKAIRKRQYWVAFTESWCGDAAQNLPVIAKMTAMNPLVSFRLLLRDQHLELMEHYLTNGTRSIPKLVIIDAETHEELAIWGPRPTPAQKIMEDYKQKPSGTKEELMEQIYGWYAKDKAETIQREFAALARRVARN